MMSKKEDVIIVAKSLLGQHERWVENINGYDYVECIYCYEHVPDDVCLITSRIKHKLDCPVLVAKDLLS